MIHIMDTEKMNINPLPISIYPAIELEISHSTMQSYHSCPRKLEFAKLFKYNLRGRGTAGDAGNALHSAAGVYLQTKNKDYSRCDRYWRAFREFKWWIPAARLIVK